MGGESDLLSPYPEAMPSTREPELVHAKQLAMDAPMTLGDRLRDVHNHIYANEGIKQYARVSDEVIKLIFTRLMIEDRSALNARLSDREIAATARSAFQTAIDATQEIQAFEEGDMLRLSDQAIAYAMRRLDTAVLRDGDPKGAAFQAILGPTLRGELGQFFTPDPVKTLLTHLTRPGDGDVCCDPASGTAGLLLEIRQFQPASRIRAAEVDSALARLARLNLFLAGEDEPEVHRLDALRPMDDLAESSSGRLGPECCDVIVSNPPFGSKGRVSDQAILSDLPNVTGGKNSVSPEVLFIERIVQLLRPGGRAGIVLPMGILSNPSTRHVRQFLRSTGRIYATVALPAETFKPTGNSVQAAILFFEKTAARPLAMYPAFRAISLSIGYDHRGRSTDSADTAEILNAWDSFRDEFAQEYPWAS
jgi:type I restriction enzyme M protein